MEDSVANFVFIHSRKFMFSKYSKRVICKVSYNLSDFEVLVYRLVAFSSLTCNFTKIFTLPQVFFTHFASRNQLPGFSAISGTLIETDFFFFISKFLFCFKNLQIRSKLKLHVTLINLDSGGIITRKIIGKPKGERNIRSHLFLSIFPQMIITVS